MLLYKTMIQPTVLHGSEIRGSSQKPTEKASVSETKILDTLMRMAFRELGQIMN